MGNNAKDLSGNQYGRLTAIKVVGKRHNHNLWLCQCMCGNSCITESSYLTTGKTRSCGCLSSEMSKERINVRFPNPHHHDRLYNIWTSMNHRCNCKTAQHFKHYGGRGISICGEWRDYNKFKEWAYANGYDENAPRGKSTLDRIDVNGNYCPENCRFVDMKTQVHNRRKKGEF